MFFVKGWMQLRFCTIKWVWNKFRSWMSCYSAIPRSMLYLKSIFTKYSFMIMRMPIDLFSTNPNVTDMFIMKLDVLYKFGIYYSGAYTMSCRLSAIYVVLTNNLSAPIQCPIKPLWWPCDPETAGSLMGVLFFLQKMRGKYEWNWFSRRS